MTKKKKQEETTSGLYCGERLANRAELVKLEGGVRPKRGADYRRTP